MNIQIFEQKFTDLFNEIDSTGLLWEDEGSYYHLYDQLDSMITSLADSQSEDKGSVFSSEAGKLIAKIEKYKRDLTKYPSLSEEQITRIIVLNRMEFLFYQQMHKMQYDMSSIHFTIADKLLQGALVTGLNGPYHQLYLEELLNHERLVQIIDDFSKTHPVQEKYGQQVKKEQKIQLSDMDTQELFVIAEKVLKETPTEFLARFPEYREGFLKQVE